MRREIRGWMIGIAALGLLCACSSAPESDAGVETETAPAAAGELDEEPEALSTEETEMVDESKEVAEPVEPVEAVEAISPLLDPDQANEQAPDQYRVRLKTTKGDIVLSLTRSWAPRGVDRFYNLVRIGYFEELAFFRVIEGFMVQFGINGDRKVNDAWATAQIKDDPVKESNVRGFLTFATAGPNTRTTQLFINFRNNASLDQQGFAPIGEVVEGMDVVDSIYSGYGEGGPRGSGPNQDRIKAQGNPYLKKGFPELDYIQSASIE